MEHMETSRGGSAAPKGAGAWREQAVSSPGREEQGFAACPQPAHGVGSRGWAICGAAPRGAPGASSPAASSFSLEQPANLHITDKTSKV